MTDRPIIFSGPMVRALLDGRKSQTRRLATSPLRKCQVGDRLYVREAFATVNSYDGPGFVYRADESYFQPEFDGPDEGAGPSFNYEKYPGEYLMWFDDLLSGVPDHGWKPSIHMPRWASRLTLTIVDVRFAKLLDINAADCIAEGAQCETCEAMKKSACHEKGCFAASNKFRKLWDSLHDKPGETIADNPNIVALTFKVSRGNIDR